jgi:4-amino-4-deoxy-L-arabinose transferase-like glycosyltransferase
VTHRPPPPESRKEAPWPRGAGAVVSVLLVVFLIVHFLSAFVLRADPDEYQMLGAAFATLRGEALFVDVWDNHGPAITWMLAAMLRLFGSNAATVILPIRGFFAAISLLTLFLVYIIAHRHVFRSKVTALLAVAVCVTTVPIAAKGYEIRGDNPMNILWVLSLLLWLRAARANSLVHFFLAGLALGACFFFSVKTLMLGLAVGLLFFTWWIMERRVRLMPVVVFGLGCAIPFALMLLILWQQGQLDAFLHDYLGKNLSRDPANLGDGFRRMRRSGKVWMVATFLSLVYGLRIYWKPANTKTLRLLWPFTAFLLFQYLFMLPTHYLQSMLPIMPLTAIFFAWMVQDFLRDGTTFGPRAAVVALFVVLAMLWTDVARIPRKVKDGGLLPPEIRHHAAMLEAIPRGALVLSGQPFPYLRDHPLRIKSFVSVLRRQIRRGELDPEIPQNLAEQDVPFVVLEHRVLQMPQETLDFIAAHYIPVEPAPLMAAGMVVPRDQSTPVEIVVAGKYHWNVDALAINGELATNPVHLPDGTYTLTWEGDEDLTLCVLPPDHWRTVEEQTTPAFEDEEDNESQD